MCPLLAFPRPVLTEALAMIDSEAIVALVLMGKDNSDNNVNMSPIGTIFTQKGRVMFYENHIRYILTGFDS